MAVIATAGHVDHGKSALVRALTGIEPDRWAAERDRGLTIDLGFAWMRLDSGQDLAFVDVPGHQRFIGNMLAGIGPSAAVMFVVAADEGWRHQSAEHLAAVDALGIGRGVLVISRTDLTDPAGLADAGTQVRAAVADSSLRDLPLVAVSARTGAGLADLRAALTAVVEDLPAPRATGRTRLWIDRVFTIRGAGTVVTGTLAEGSFSTGEQVHLHAGAATRALRVRALRSLGAPVDRAAATTRVAVNLPDLDRGDAARGHALLTGDWPSSDLVDVRVRPRAAGPEPTQPDLPGRLMLHVGTADVPVAVRRLGGDILRLRLSRELPLITGDRAILRDPGLQRVFGGIEVLDVSPAALTRRGSGAARAAALSNDSLDPYRQILDHVEREGAIEVAELIRRGLPVPGPDEPTPGLLRFDDWLVSGRAHRRWGEHLRDLLTAAVDGDPLDPSVTVPAAVTAIGLPRREWLAGIAEQIDAEVVGGRVQLRGTRPDLGAAQPGLAELERRLADRPWAAPEQHELQAAGLGPRQLAAAERLGRVVRLTGGIVMLPTGPAAAMRVLTTLPQPFTTSAAREALGTTRRVAIPLLEHLDARGWTRRLADSRREVARAK